MHVVGRTLVTLFHVETRKYYTLIKEQRTVKAFSRSATALVSGFFFTECVAVVHQLFYGTHENSEKVLVSHFSNHSCASVFRSSDSAGLETDSTA